MSSILPNDSVIVLDPSMSKNEITLTPHIELLLGYKIINKTGKPVFISVSNPYEDGYRSLTISHDC